MACRCSRAPSVRRQFGLDALTDRSALCVSTMTKTASLGMYEFATTRAALDSLWAAVAQHLRAAGMADVPVHLTRDEPLESIWRGRPLLLAQTCGYPMRTQLSGLVRLVATPVYEVPGCDGTVHRSFIVVRGDAAYRSLADLRGARAAVNGIDSNSGMNLFRAALAPVAGGRPMFRHVSITGAHAASLAAVAEGAADVAAIDCVSFWFASRERPEIAARVRVLAETPPSPGLPLVTRRDVSDRDIAILRAALIAAADSAATAAARATLRLAGFAILPDEAYDVVLDYERQAIAAGYPELA